MPVCRRKVTVIGAGNVGATAAQRIAEAGVADVYLIDVVEGLPQGKALDLVESAPLQHHDQMIYGTNDYADTTESDVIVVTAGLARQPGMTRDDLLLKNAVIVRDVVGKAVHYSPDAILVIVTNPLDAMVHVALEDEWFPTGARHRHGRGPGQRPISRPSSPRTWASPPPTSRPSCWAATATPWCRCRALSTVAGIPLPELMKPERIEALVQRTRNGGAEVVALLKSGSAFYAPASSVLHMVDSILNDRKRVLPCAVLLRGEYDIDGLVVGVPIVLGASGVERIIEVALTDGGEGCPQGFGRLGQRAWSRRWQKART